MAKTKVKKKRTSPKKRKRRKKAGQPTKYRPAYVQQIIKFFNIEPYEVTTETFYYKNGDEKVKEVRVPCKLPFFSAFARKIGVCVDTLNEWCKVHPKFSEAYKAAKALQKEILITNGLMGLYKPTSFIFTAKNIAGMRDEVHEDTSPEAVKKALTIDEMIERLTYVKSVGDGIDVKSIKGNGNG